MVTYLTYEENEQYYVEWILCRGVIPSDFFKVLWNKHPQCKGLGEDIFFNNEYVSDTIENISEFAAKYYISFAILSDEQMIYLKLKFGEVKGIM